MLLNWRRPSIAGREWRSPGPAKRTGTAWETRPMPAPRIGQIGQKYQAPAVSPTANHTVSTMTTIAR